MRQIRRNWWSAWEDLHPLARGAVLIVLTMLVFSGVLWVLAWLGPQMMSLDLFFKLRAVEEIWALANLVLAVLMAYTLLRIGWMVIRKQATLLNIIVVCVGIGALSVSLILKPTLFQGAIRHQTGHPYHEVFDNFGQLCDAWVAEGQLVVDFDDVAVGVLSDAYVWRESSTVFFDFGDSEQAFGLACVVTGSEPFKTGRLSRNFEYQHIRDQYYEFYTKDASS